MEPVLERLRLALERCRAAGASFDDAWPVGLAAAGREMGRGRDREMWRRALNATRESWQAAYTLERAPTRGELAVQAMYGYPDQEPSDDAASLSSSERQHLQERGVGLQAPAPRLQVRPDLLLTNGLC